MARPKKPKLVDVFNRQERQRKLRAAQAKAPKELELWHKWNKGGRRKADLIPLMSSLENVVRAEARKYQKGYGGALVGGANEAELRTHMLKALQTYNPNRNVKLTTWATSQMRAFTGTAAKRRNFGTQSKGDFQATQAFNNAINELRFAGNLSPTPQQIAERVGWPVSRVKRMQRGAMRRELYTGITPGQDDDVGGAPSQVRSAMSLMHFKNEEEKKVFRALKLYAPKDELSSPLNMARTAKKLKIPLSRLYKIRDNLKKRAAPILNRL
jgi:DNA-directed RNA polymerase specialized sigma subunit